MELISPTSVSSQIVGIIESAQKELIIVSPYNNFEDFENKSWKHILTAFKKVIKREVKISYYVRKGTDYKALDVLGIKPIPIEGLHAKMYLNENTAILSSMNLLKVSADQAIDFAVKTTSREEYKIFRDYFDEHIKEVAELTQAKRDSFQSLEKEIQNESPVCDFYAGMDFYKKVRPHLVKSYYPKSYFIKEIGFLDGEAKVGHWFHFNPNGLLCRTEAYFDGSCDTQDIEYLGKVSRYDLVFAVANIIGGLYRCSIQDIYFKSNLRAYIGENPELFYKHIEAGMGIKHVDRQHATVEQLVDELHQLIRKKPVFS